MINVLFLFSCNCCKRFTQAPGPDLADARIAGNCKRLEHDLLNDEAADKVARRNAAQERRTQPPPVLALDILLWNNAELSPFAGKCCGMAALVCSMFLRFSFLVFVCADLRERLVVH